MTDRVSTSSTSGERSTSGGRPTSEDALTAVRYERDGDGIVTLTLDDPTASANTMNELYQRSMQAAVARLYDEVDEVTGVVVASAKKTFFAGGNLTLMMQAGPDDAASVFAGAEAIKADLRRLERYPRPVVAAINGAALGGGFEIALACQHRIVVDHPSAVVGLPEATLGLLPGGGGVTRIVRMLGLQSGLMDVLLQGTRFKPADALAKGLVDEVVASRDDLVPAATAWLLEHRDDPEAASNPWDRPGYRMPGGTSRRSPPFCGSRPRARSTPPSGRSSPRPSRVPARTSTRRAGSRAVT
jgi:3-hydroxyacyl-CoA dehydrogenase/enoyl-CoA hydratase/3-hydroxybutyryl-CoA epimerase